MEEEYKKLSETCLQYRNYFINEVEKLQKENKPVKGSVEYNLYKIFSLLHISFDEAAIYGEFKDLVLLRYIWLDVEAFRFSQDYITYIDAKAGRNNVDEFVQLICQNLKNVTE